MTLPGSKPKQVAIAMCTVGSLAAATALVGCQDEPEAQVVQRPAPVERAPAAPPKPAITPISQLMVSLAIDGRVVLPEERAPGTDAERIAVLEYFDAFARGDAESVGTMMSDLDRRELDALVETDVWKDTCDGIGSIALETGAGPYGEKCALARIWVDGDLQPQLWYYAAGDDGVRFEAVPSPPDIASKLHGDDWIGLWHQLLEEEKLLANQLDAEIEQSPVILAEGSRGGGGTAPGVAPKNPTKPGFSPPGGKPDRRPAGKKRKPPGSR